MEITDTAAISTANVIMTSRVSVKPGFCANGIQPLYDTVFRQEFQVPINRTQADSGHPLSYNLIELSRGRVGCQFAELFQNHLTLPGISLWFFSGQRYLLRL